MFSVQVTTPAPPASLRLDVGDDELQVVVLAKIAAHERPPVPAADDLAAGVDAVDGSLCSHSAAMRSRSSASKQS
jgi:hypothetical protein